MTPARDLTAASEALLAAVEVILAAAELADEWDDDIGVYEQELRDALDACPDDICGTLRHMAEARAEATRAAEAEVTEWLGVAYDLTRPEPKMSGPHYRNIGPGTAQHIHEAVVKAIAALEAPAPDPRGEARCAHKRYPTDLPCGATEADDWHKRRTWEQDPELWHPFTPEPPAPERCAS